MLYKKLKRFHHVEKYCEYCGKPLKLNTNRDIERKRFCSKSCCTKYTKPNLGCKHSEEAKKKMSKARIGKPGLRGEKHPSWKGGKTKQRGYVYVHTFNHPHGGYMQRVREHRLIMEEYLNCYLEPNLIVHHKNGIKDDNRLENLELMTRREHSCHHQKS